MPTALLAKLDFLSFGYIEAGAGGAADGAGAGGSWINFPYIE